MRVRSDFGAEVKMEVDVEVGNQTKKKGSWKMKSVVEGWTW